MFAVIEKNGERKAVHSNGDLAYMVARGWKPVDIETKQTTNTLHLPKKRGRPSKG
jgi:hypothetical protein